MDEIRGLLLIAHDVGGSRDRSTAVVGGYCGYAPGILSIREFNESSHGLYGSARQCLGAD